MTWYDLGINLDIVGAVRNPESMSSAVVRVTPGGEATIVATNDEDRLPLGMRIDMSGEGVITVALASAEPDVQLHIVYIDDAAGDTADPTQRVALVIDDERANRAYYSAVFEQMGWSVHSAADGHSGISAFAADSPVMVLVDVRLPDMNGYQVVRQLRVQERRPALIVLMSSDPAMVDPGRALIVGADAALVAPVGISQLRSLLERVIPSVDRATKAAAVDPSRFWLAFDGNPRIYDGAGWRDLPPGAVRDGLAILAAVHPGPLRADELVRSLGECATAGNDAHVDRTRNGEAALRVLFGWLRRHRCADVIAVSGGGYRLAISAEQIDTLTFEQSAVRLMGADLGPERFADVAKGLLDQTPLEAYVDVATPLVDAARARLREARAALEEALSIRLILLGNTPEALLLLRRLTSVEPWREGAWELLMIALYRQGRQREALDLFDHIRTVLIESVGVDPCPALRNVHAMIRNQDVLLLRPDFPYGVAGRAPSSSPVAPKCLR